MNHLDDYCFPVKPSPFDERDYIFETLNNTIAHRGIVAAEVASPEIPPVKLDLRKHLQSPRNQGSRGTCVAFASCTMKEYQEKLDVDFNQYMSPNSVYFYRSIKPDSGMYLRDAMTILHKRGICPEAAFPYHVKNEPSSVPQDALDAMSTYKIKTYASVNTIDGLKEALYKNGPCIIAFPVYSTTPEFWRPGFKDEKMHGGHCVCVIGYDETGFILRNSWGAFWNGNGYVHYPFADFGAHWEIWTSVDDESPHWPPPPEPSVVEGCTTTCTGFFIALKRKLQLKRGN